MRERGFIQSSIILNSYRLGTSWFSGGNTASKVDAQTRYGKLHGTHVLRLIFVIQAESIRYFFGLMKKLGVFLSGLEVQ